MSGVNKTKMVNYKDRDKELESYSSKNNKYGMPDPVP